MSRSCFISLALPWSTFHTNDWQEIKISSQRLIFHFAQKMKGGFKQTPHRQTHLFMPIDHIEDLCKGVCCILWELSTLESTQCDASGRVVSIYFLLCFQIKQSLL